MIARYLRAMRSLGDVSLGSTALRDALRVGDTDMWMASSLRESSLWADPTLVDQIRSLIDDESEESNLAPRTGVVRTRSALAWLRALTHALVRRKPPATKADVMFVQYWPTPNSGRALGTTGEWTSPYFGNLPDELRKQGISVGFLHLHSVGSVTAAPPNIRHAVRSVDASRHEHVLLADYFSLRSWWRGAATWIRICRRVPSLSRLTPELGHSSDASTLWRWWKPKLQQSVHGSHGVRTALLTQMFETAVTANSTTKLWVLAFEGQSWESCLVRTLESRNLRWFPYLHTMMRPWDLRAHTFISELPLKRLAVHGPHDASELGRLGTGLVEVEALRYQHLGTEPSLSTSSQSRTDDAGEWLVVGGADCESSLRELKKFSDAMRLRNVNRHIVVKWHPQCGQPVEIETELVTLSSEPLKQLCRGASAALMVGRAAPLDTYLAGVPSCSLEIPSGLAMSPIEEDAFHHVAVDADAAVDWMCQAESRSGFVPPIADYFVIDPLLPKWKSLIEDQLR